MRDFFIECFDDKMAAYLVWIATSCRLLSGAMPADWSPWNPWNVDIRCSDYQILDLKGALQATNLRIEIRPFPENASREYPDPETTRQRALTTLVWFAQNEHLVRRSPRYPDNVGYICPKGLRAAIILAA